MKYSNFSQSNSNIDDTYSVDETYWIERIAKFVDEYELGKRHGIIYEHNIFLDKVISVLANIERKQ